MLTLFLAAAIGSSLGNPNIVPVIASVQGPVFSGASTNTVWPVTNYGTVCSSNIVTNANSGGQYSFTFPTNYAVVGFDNYTPEVAGFVNNQTVWGTNGTFRYRLLLQATNGNRSACAGSLNCATSAGNWTFFSFSNYASGTLGGVLLTNLTARTNAGRDGILWDSISATGWKWHTNGLLYGVTGYTGLSQMSSWNAGFPWKFTAITKRHAYSAGHVFGPGTTNGSVYFVGTDGATNSMFVSDCRWAFNGTAGDYCIVFFTNDLPATVSPLKVCESTNALHKFPINRGMTLPIPILETCQHGRVGSQMMSIYDSHAMHQGGDSGNPTLFIVGNELVNCGGTSGTLLGTNFVNDMNALTLAAGLDTNSYQPVLYDTSSYPFFYP